MSEPAPPLSLGESAYRRLRADIVACRLAPGRRLTEKQLSADTGLGMSSVRDALTRLDHEGLVRTLPRRGYQVTPLTPKSIDDLFVLWELIGPELIRLGITYATPEQIAAARAVFERPGGADGDAEAVMPDIEAVNTAFGILAEATGNTYLLPVYQRLRGDMSRIGTLLRSADPAAVLVGPAQHWVQRVLGERDADEAAAQARGHIREIHRRVMQAVARWPSVMSSEVVAAPR